MNTNIAKILVGSSMIAGSIAVGEALKLEKRFTGAFDRLTAPTPKKKTSKKGKVLFFGNTKERRCAK